LARIGWSANSVGSLGEQAIRFASLSSACQQRLFSCAIFIALVPLCSLIASCGGAGGGTTSPPPPITYAAKSGVAQKGPLIQGSTVTAQELDSTLSPTGKEYSYQTTSNLGVFSPTSTFGSQYIGVSATGYYFDEVANAVSTGTVTLNGYSDLSSESVLNINLLTTLAYQRIQHLVVDSKMTFSAARTQAEREVLAALNIPPGSYGSFGALDLGGTSDGDHILAAISSIFVYGNSSGPLSQLIGNFQSDIGSNGFITNAATQTSLASAAKNVDPSSVAANLTQAYSSVGVSFVAADIANWIDKDGDGVIGKFKFQVADAMPSSIFTFPSFVVDAVADTTVSATGGELLVNQHPVTGTLTVHQGDVLTLSPGAGVFPNGVLSIYLVSGTAKIARVSFVSDLLSIAVTPDSSSIPKGLTQQFTATGTFSDTSAADLTDSVTWSSGTPNVATVNATSGLAQTLAVGSTVITATSGSVAASTTLNVTTAVLESIAITPNPAFSLMGTTTQLTATGTYSDGTTANVTNAAQWTSSDSTVATVGPTTGVVTGLSLGPTTIKAAIGSVNGSTPLAVTELVQVTNGGVTLVLDTRLGVTWTADATLLSSQFADVSTIVADANLPGSSLAGLVTTSSFRSDGTMSWYGALAWVNYLNKISYGGYNNWTLPTANNAAVAGGPGCTPSSVGCGPSTSGTLNQLSYIFINELGNVPGSQATNAGPFQNMLTNRSSSTIFWSGTGCYTGTCLPFANLFWTSIDNLGDVSIDGPGAPYGYALAVRSN
jgi:uncharacterized protein YjdB